MSGYAALVRAMSAAGAPPEAIALALDAIEQRDAADQARRDAARDKKRRQRAEARDMTGTVPGQSRDTGGTVPPETPTPSPSFPPDPLTNPTPAPVDTSRARKAASATGCRLPADWQPQPFTGDLGKATGAWPPGALDRELARFRDWAASATGPHARKSDWQAAWRNWIRKVEDEGRYASASIRSSRPTSGAPIDGFGLALARAEQRTRSPDHW